MNLKGFIYKWCLSLAFVLTGDNLFGDIQHEYIPPTGKITPIHSFPDKSGENISAHRLAGWRMYLPNPPTYSERKTKPFWMHLLYHGGWALQPGHQPRKRGFHVSNSFGVWEHDPAADNLIFKYMWPFHVKPEYDIANDCYWAADSGNNPFKKVLLYFALSEKGTPKNIQIFQIPFKKYCFTDPEGVAWFDDNGSIILKKGKLYVQCHQDNEKPPLSYRQARLHTDTMYRNGRNGLQEYKNNRWNDCPLPEPLNTSVKSFDQKDNAVLMCNGEKTFEWYTQCGICFILTKKVDIQWTRFDSDGRRWMASYSGLYCLLPQEYPAPDYDEFVTLLPKILQSDQIDATNTMRKLLSAGDNYAPWIAENLNNTDDHIKQAASSLCQCLNGKKMLTFEGDAVVFKKLIDGKGIAPERLPIPPKNQEKKGPFMETDPQILDITNAGYLKNAELIEMPVLEHDRFLFCNTGNVLTSRNDIKNVYLEVEHNKTNRYFIENETAGNIWSAHKAPSPDEMIVLMSASQDKIMYAGKLNIEDGSLRVLGEFPNKYYSLFNATIDSHNRFLGVARQGYKIFYQNHENGKFLISTVPPPMAEARYADIVFSKSNKRIFVFRGLYQKQWEGTFSEIFEFKEGNLVPLNMNVCGHIYNMFPLSDDVLLLFTYYVEGYKPRDVLFKNSLSGKSVPPLFDIPDASKPYFNCTAGLHDHQGNFWFCTIVPIEHHLEQGKVYMWDGHSLSTIVQWTVKTTTLNPYRGNMCITNNGLVWVGIKEKMLIIDSKTMNHRFFRVLDWKSIPHLFPLDDDWITANYNHRATIFHLKY